MEVSALRHRGTALRGPTPLLRLQSDDRLVALTRRGNQAAYEVLVSRYQARLLAFCRHMLSSREDAEDVLQEVFAAAFNAMLADSRPINVRPWLYRIARNRSLNHLRRTQAIGVDSMDVHLADHGATTADRVHEREDLRELVGDVQELPETQRTALLLREIDALSYEQIAEAMETTVPSVKSLLVRARVSLAEAAEARKLTCDEVRDELGEVAEGLQRKSPPVRRHVRKCERCAAFEKQLRQTNRALAAVMPVGPLLLIKKFLITHAGAGGAAASGAAAGSAATAGAGAGAGGALSAGLTTVATKAAAGLSAAAIVTAGAVEVDHSRKVRKAAATQAVPAAVTALPDPAPRVVASIPQPAGAIPADDAPAEPRAKGTKAEGVPSAADPADSAPGAALATADEPTAAPATGTEPGPAPASDGPETGSDTTVMPGGGSSHGGFAAPTESQQRPPAQEQPAEQEGTPAQPEPAEQQQAPAEQEQAPAEQEQAPAEQQQPAEEPQPAPRDAGVEAATGTEPVTP